MNSTEAISPAEGLVLSDLHLLDTGIEVDGVTDESTS
jgi:hypothetical protein